MTDNINRPEHYTYGRFECVDVIHELTQELAGIQAFCLGNTIKYLWRFQHKNGVEDLEKARWYLDRLIKEFIEPKENDSNPKEIDTKSNKEVKLDKGLRYRITPEGKREYIDIIDSDTNKYFVEDNKFHESNYVYQEQSEYLGDATNPNACVSTNKPNPNYTNKHSPRPVYQLDSDMNVIKKYKSIHAAVKDIMNGGVGYAVRHGTRCNGYYWRYVDE